LITGNTPRHPRTQHCHAQFRTLCSGTPTAIRTVTITAPMTINWDASVSKLVLYASHVRIVATAGVTINVINALEGECVIQMRGTNANITNFAISDKGGACVCSTARNARLGGWLFSGSFANLAVEPGATVASIANTAFQGGERYGIINGGAITLLTGLDFQGGLKQGAILNTFSGNITTLEQSSFTGMNAGGGACPDSAAVVVNEGNMNTIQTSNFDTAIVSGGCAVLCCAVLCCAVLCCAVLCCAVLCCGQRDGLCDRQ
jgi:hypothetical protein